jgi:hypothetical protein
MKRATRPTMTEKDVQDTTTTTTSDERETARIAREAAEDAQSRRRTTLTFTGAGEFTLSKGGKVTCTKAFKVTKRERGKHPGVRFDFEGECSNFGNIGCNISVGNCCMTDCAIGPGATVHSSGGDFFHSSNGKVVVNRVGNISGGVFCGGNMVVTRVDGNISGGTFYCGPGSGGLIINGRRVSDSAATTTTTSSDNYPIKPSQHYDIGMECPVINKIECSGAVGLSMKWTEHVAPDSLEIELCGATTLSFSDRIKLGEQLRINASGTAQCCGTEFVGTIEDVDVVTTGSSKLSFALQHVKELCCDSSGASRIGVNGTAENMRLMASGASRVSGPRGTKRIRATASGASSISAGADAGANVSKNASGAASIRI